MEWLDNFLRESFPSLLKSTANLLDPPLHSSGPHPPLLGPARSLETPRVRRAFSWKEVMRYTFKYPVNIYYIDNTYRIYIYIYIYYTYCTTYSIYIYIHSITYGNSYVARRDKVKSIPLSAVSKRHGSTHKRASSCATRFPHQN